MSQAVKCHPFLYADDSCFVCKHKDINGIEKHLNVDFVYVIRLWIVRIRQNQYSLNLKNWIRLWIVRIRQNQYSLNLKN